MSDLQPFQAIQEQVDLTDGEELALKQQLSVLRKQYVQQIRRQADMRSIRSVEAEIDQIEHTLAHARVIY